MDQKSTIAKLIENTPLAVIIVGLFIFGLGAAGGWAKIQIQINDLPGRVALASMGAIVALVGVALLWREKNRASSENITDVMPDYGVKITSPRDDAEVEVDKLFEVRGSYATKPPDELIRIIEYSPARYTYRPRRYVIYNLTQKTWSASTLVAGADQRVILVCSVGRDGKALFDYYDKVYQTTNQWVGIRTLPADVKEYDRITVRVKREQR